MKIAIDGPSGAGKSSLAKAVAKRLGILYVDTGAMYRSIGLFASRHGIELENAAKVVPLLPSCRMEMRYENGVQRMFLNGKDVSEEIRTPLISKYASAVSAVPEVREFLLEAQRKTARENSVVMDGRDIGTVILPDADVKIFLTASIEARAKRRYDELTTRGRGDGTTYETVLNDMEARDKNDRTRKIAPAIPAADAVMLDNSLIDEKVTVDEAIKIITERTAGKRT